MRNAAAHGNGFTLVTAGAIPLLLCCVAQVQYAASVLHHGSDFSGADLSSRSIVLITLLTPRGVYSARELSSASQARLLRRIRPDLRITDRLRFEKSVAVAADSTLVERFYRDLIDRKALSARSHYAIWERVEEDFLLCVFLRSGSTVRAFDGSEYRAVTLEGELWDRRRVDVVWRAAVEGRMGASGKGEQRFIRGALDELFRAMPAHVPFPGDAKW